MNSHKHARLTTKGRAQLVKRVVDQGWKVVSASQLAGVSECGGYKWLTRFKAESSGSSKGGARIAALPVG